MDMCPCGSGDSYTDCCGPLHREGAGLGTTAEQLMRARYSAYVLEDAAFVLSSWHPDTRPSKSADVFFDTGDAPPAVWHGLTVLEVEGGSALATTGVVEFQARYSRGKEHFELHERSTFTRLDGRWVYLDGT